MSFTPSRAGKSLTVHGEGLSRGYADVLTGIAVCDVQKSNGSERGYYCIVDKRGEDSGLRSRI